MGILFDKWDNSEWDDGKIYNRHFKVYTYSAHQRIILSFERLSM